MYITITELLKKYKCSSRSQILRDIKLRKINFKKNGRIILIDEESFLSECNIPRNFLIDNFVKIKYIKLKFSVSTKTILDYINKYNIPSVIIKNHRYVSIDIFSKYIDDINANKLLQNKNHDRNNEFENKIDSCIKGFYKRLDPYTNMKTKIHFKHLLCGNIVEFLPDNILNGKPFSCKYCTMSGPEEEIYRYLIDRNIKVETQHRIENYLFDFFLPEKNILIEYDGEQHFMDVDLYKSGGDLKTTQSRDLMKNKIISKNKQYTLIRISYNNKKNLKKIIYDIASNSFRDYSLGKYKQLFENSVVLSDNIIYIG